VAATGELHLEPLVHPQFIVTSFSEPQVWDNCSPEGFMNGIDDDAILNLTPARQ